MGQLGLAHCKIWCTLYQLVYIKAISICNIGHYCINLYSWIFYIFLLVCVFVMSVWYYNTTNKSGTVLASPACVLVDWCLDYILYKFQSNTFTKQPFVSPAAKELGHWHMYCILRSFLGPGTPPHLRYAWQGPVAVHNSVVALRLSLWAWGTEISFSPSPGCVQLITCPLIPGLWATVP